jgi:bifunctional UDP-N-acetylglucosamine pyrophosphorylase/glucosamine-1-phosphate N-acetyltransferase
MSNYSAVILAAGQSKRMMSKKSKVVHSICGKAVIEWVVENVEKAGVKDIVTIVGHMAEQVMECIGDRSQYAMQNERLGTGHAVMQAKQFLSENDGHVIVLCGDTPLIKTQTIKSILDYQIKHNLSATVLTAKLKDPTGYGRIIRNKDESVLKIVEQKDANAEEQLVNEINSGVYCFKAQELLGALDKISNNNSQGEYYLTDTLEIMIKNGLKVGAMVADDAKEILGINNRLQLAEANAIIRQRILEQHMLKGVTIIDPSNTYIDDGSEIGADTIVYPGTIIEGKCKIGEDCIIGPNTRLISSEIENDSEVINSVVVESSVGSDTHVGPFAYIRPGSKIGSHVKIGDFVEIKKSVIGDNTKLSHLTYVGDAEIGKNVNMGCGVVVVNYDGKKKNKTIVGDNAFVGCNVNLVSPLEVGENAYIAAGSTITDKVPENALAIARERQVIKEDWVIKKNMGRNLVTKE